MGVWPNMPRRPLQGRFPETKNRRWRKCPPPTMPHLRPITFQSMVWASRPAPRCAPKIATYEWEFGRTCHAGPSRAVFQKQKILGGENALHLRSIFCGQSPFNQCFDPQDPLPGVHLKSPPTNGSLAEHATQAGFGPGGRWEGVAAGRPGGTQKAGPDE